MECILRFSGAGRRDPGIDTWLRSQREVLRPLAEEWFAPAAVRRLRPRTDAQLLGLLEAEA